MLRTLLRTTFKCFYRTGRSYRVPFGPNRKKQLAYEPSIQLHQMLGFYDRKIFEALEKLVFSRGRFEQGSVFCDIGANIGYYSLWLSKKAAEVQGRVYAFEPNKKVQRLLKRNIAENRVKNVEVVGSAVADRSGTVSFHQSEDHHCSSLIKANAGEASSAQEISAISLDDYFEKFSTAPSFIKMDIEGAGTLALKGCERIFTQGRPVMLIESHTPEEDAAIREVSQKYAYRVYRPSDGQWITPQEIGGTVLLLPEEVSHAA